MLINHERLQKWKIVNDQTSGTPHQHSPKKKSYGHGLRNRVSFQANVQVAASARLATFRKRSHVGVPTSGQENVNVHDKSQGRFGQNALLFCRFLLFELPGCFVVFAAEFILLFFCGEQCLGWVSRRRCQKALVN